MPVPDEHIHPVATGPAAAIVKAHSEPVDGGVTFYSGWFCPFVARVWITLEERKIPYHYVEINPYKKDPEFLKLNPKGLVPALEHHGKALYESLVLIDYIEDAFPDHPNSLLPPLSDPYGRAFARLWTDFISKSVIPTFFRLVQAQEDSARNTAREDFVKALKQLTEKRTGPFFLGEKLGLVDVAIAPWLERLYILEKHRGFKEDDVGQDFVEWKKAITSKESVKNVLSDREHYEEIYGRYLRDEAQSEAAKATRSGKAIP
ncbi:glutathione-S-transferase [Saitoella complicata NRRL Y-17804]|uniref:Glutathione transferase n=1 Tax=Saitoella complicata (strain BCRC 22490 / CBS 7301 / JCM 7358 / NBRC 10748 / NRRL Y-17804) TaxID=698492 RepID=A0A0E9NB43_SAICN|nr:glutathione-S-transferase [Saitoella complicata NRRL Y-17804]ODQ55224.1 glutathione-S-transferase [Saitoella complicata NRRL Y-17804]GAO47059.1 hypothetical protein G7K_1271-t1 [Saitoella complicata NRRL Y-17804]